MLRHLLLTAVLLAAVPSTAAASTLPGEWRDDAITDVVDELLVLGQLGAWEDDEVVAAVTARYEVDAATVADLIDELIENEDEAFELVLEADAAGVGLSDPVESALLPMSEGDFERVLGREQGFLDPTDHLQAVADLVLRDGASPLGPREASERSVVLDVLAAPAGFGLDDGGDEPADPQGSPASAEQGAAEAPVTTDLAATTAAQRSGLPWLPVGGVTVAGLALVGLVGARRRRPAGDHDLASPGPVPPAPPLPAPAASASPSPRRLHLTDVLESSRRMTAALDRAEVQRIVVRDAVRLTDADAGAFLAVDGDVLRFTAMTDDAFFAAEPGREGVLARVVETAVPIHAVLDTDPALVELPMAVAAAPVVAGGGVVGALVLLRTAARPFASSDVDTLELLTPPTGSALAAAAAHHGAVVAAEVDGLTQLHNRRRLDHDLAAVRGDGDVAFAMVDVDHFKTFNDTNGHAAGDVALQLVARTLADTVRDGDVVYRYGGEEFSVLLHGCDRDGATAIMERVRTAVEQLRVPGAETQPLGRLTISVGVALLDVRGQQDLQLRADAALYEAKEAGRNQVVWSA